MRHAERTQGLVYSCQASPDGRAPWLPPQLLVGAKFLIETLSLPPPETTSARLTKESRTCSFIPGLEQGSGGDGGGLPGQQKQNRFPNPTRWFAQLFATAYVANGTLPFRALAFHTPSAWLTHRLSSILYYSYYRALALSDYLC